MGSGCDDVVSMRLKSDPRHLGVVREMVRTFCQVAGFDEARTHQLALAVDEGCANIIRHAYGGDPDGDIEVSCEIMERDGLREMVIVLRDRGRPADPARLAPRERDESAPHSLRPGGLGLHFIRRIMDTVEFRRSDAEGNVLRLTVTCPPAAGPGE